MKRILKGLLTIALSFLFMQNVYAATAKFNISTSSSQIIVGNSVTVSLTISSSSPALGAWEYTLNYDSSYFKLVSKDVDLHYAGVANNNKTKSVTYKYTFKALKAGSSKFYVDSTSALDIDENNMTVSNGSKTVSIITYAEYQASLSSNNYLMSLGVENQEISPVFNKDTDEYLVQVTEDTKSIKINASAEDTHSTVNGTGTFEVTPGNNTFEIVVVAQNGSERTYKLTVEVLDKNPINVEVDGKNYTIVKLANNLKKPESYEEKTIEIKGLEIPAFYSEVTNFTLVGLKDESGNIALYIYDNGKYEKYVELIFGNLTIYPTKQTMSVEYFQDAKVTIQGNEFDALVCEKNNRYYLIKGLNVETKEEGYYLYDSKDQTLMKYDETILNELIKQNKIFMLVVLVFGISTFGFFIIILCMLHKNKKLKKIIKASRKEAKPKEEKKEEIKEVKKEEKTVEKTKKKPKTVESDAKE